MAKTSIKLNPFHAAIIQQTNPHAKSIAEGARELMANGLRHIMATGKYSAKAISVPFMDGKTANDIFYLFDRFVDAACSELGLDGPLQNSCRLEKVPACSKYAEEGKDVYVVLATNEIMNENGDIIVKW